MTCEAARWFAAYGALVGVLCVAMLAWAVTADVSKVWPFNSGDRDEVLLGDFSWRSDWVDHLDELKRECRERGAGFPQNARDSNQIFDKAMSLPMAKKRKGRGGRKC